jgi:hypothetical protein
MVVDFYREESDCAHPELEEDEQVQGVLVVGD